MTAGADADQPGVASAAQRRPPTRTRRGMCIRGVHRPGLRGLGTPLQPRRCLLPSRRRRRQRRDLIHQGGAPSSIPPDDGWDARSVLVSPASRNRRQGHSRSCDISPDEVVIRRALPRIAEHSPQMASGRGDRLRTCSAGSPGRRCTRSRLPLEHDAALEPRLHARVRDPMSRSDDPAGLRANERIIR
jgi:hypothetical protein